jgi:signal transduction histidine kinase
MSNSGEARRRRRRVMKPGTMPQGATYADLLRRIDELENDAVAIAAIAAAAGREHDEGASVVQHRLATLVDALSHAHENLASTLRLNSTTTRLLAEVGHDMNQPLTVIVGALEILAIAASDPQLALIARANAAAGRMERAFIALMEMARLESSIVTPKLRSFPLALLFAELQSQHEDAARKKALELRVHETDQKIVTDPTLLASILHNLVGNAIRYTEKGHIAIDARPHGAWCSIEVADTGIGINERGLSAIFDDFKQLASVPGPGAGLGLAIVKRTANLLGLPLAVTSALGKGSRFSVEVPLVAAAERPAA